MARVASGNDVESPWSGRRAALVRWHFSGRRTPDGQNQNHRTRVEVFDHLASGVMGEHLVLEADGKSILVASEGARIFLPGGWEGQAVDSQLPAIFESVRPQLETEGVLCYGEQSLSRGEEVLLIGWIEPTGAGEGAYRSGSRYDFVTRADVSPPQIIDKLLA